MIIDRHQPANLFEMLPELRLELDPELAELDALLEDDDLFERVKHALCQRRQNSATLGRHSTPVEVVLWMLVVKRLYDFSYEETERFVSDSITLRQFCRLYLEPAPDGTTLIRWANVIGPDTVEELNERVVELERTLKVTRGRKLRTDGTVVETDIHHPTDSGLLADGVRVLGRLARKAKSVVDENARESAPDGRFRDRSRSARRLTNQIARLGRRLKSDAARDKYQEAYGRLMKVARTSVEQAQQLTELLEEVAESGKQKVSSLREDIEHFAGLLTRVISQTKRRVVEGERVQATEKLVSIFEPHTEIICRGKSGKPTEFGRKVWLSEVEGGIVSSYRILDGNPSDAEQIQPELDQHIRLFGTPPKLLAADRGCYSPENERRAEDLGVEKACLPKPVSKTEDRKRYEKQRWFKRAQKFRAGSEGRISVLKRRGHLDKCRDHGEVGFERWVGWGILSGNLSTIARSLAYS